MPDVSTLAVFAATAFALLLVPGPVTLYVVARGIDQGRRAALVSVLGIQAGDAVHIGAAAAGLSALLVSSAFAFSVVEYAGAAYLIYLGLRTLFTRPKMHMVDVRPQLSLRRVFMQGAVVNILNPKTALFFFAFLPQFVDPSRGLVAGQIVALGVLFMALGLVADGAYALLAGTLGGWLRDSVRFLRIRRYLTGGTYLALGTAAAVGGSGQET
jgi:threonine/homoserine/homoserine lactone efflux protein